MKTQKTKNKIAGIDYSMTCPCLCIHTGDTWSFSNCQFFFYTTKKKDVISLKNITGELQEEWNCSEERYEKLTHWTMKKFYNFDDPNMDHEKILENVFIEGYAMGAKGQVFNIGENGGLLKHYLWSDNFKYEVLSPSTVKKFATEKGNADKLKMYESFVEDTGCDLEKIMVGKKGSSPLADIVDAYFIAKLGFKLLIDRSK